MKKVLGIILTLAILLTGLTGFGLAEGENGTLFVSFPTGNIRIAINILAQQKGYFTEEGVTVQEVNLGGMDALTAINGDGNLDLLVTGFVPDLQAIGNGYDLTVIGGTAVEGGAVIAKEGNAANFQAEGTIINWVLSGMSRPGSSPGSICWTTASALNRLRRSRTKQTEISCITLTRQP